MQSGFNGFNSGSPVKYNHPNGSQVRNVNTSSRQTHGQSSGCLRLFIFLIPLLFGFFALSQGIQILNNYEGVTEQQALSNKVFDYVSDNLTTAPLHAAQNAVWSETATCPDGYDQASWGQWKGLNGGSLCQEKNPLNHHDITVLHTTEYGYVHPTSCKIVSEQDAIDINAWRATGAVGGAAQKILCVQRVTNLEITGEKCAADKKNIYNGELNATTNKREGILCATETGVEKIAVAAAVTATATGAAAANKALPIIGFRIEGGDAAAEGCWRSDRTGQTKSKKTYPLEVEQMKGCGSTYETRKAGGAVPTSKDNFTPVAGAAKTNSIKEVWANNFSADLKPFEFRTTYPATDVYHLVAERRLFYSSDADCARMEPQEFGNIDNMVADMKTTLNGLAITLIVLGSLIIFAALAFYLLRHTSLKDQNGNKCLYALFLIAVIIALALCITFFVYRYENQGLQEKSEDLKAIEKAGCFDQNSKKINPALTALQSFTESSYKTYETQVWVLFWGTILAILAAAFFIHTKQAAFPPVPLEDPFRE